MTETGRIEVIRNLQAVPERAALIKRDMDQMLYRLPQTEDEERAFDHVREPREKESYPWLL
jgi:hypothetical protein